MARKPADKPEDERAKNPPEEAVAQGEAQVATPADAAVTASAPDTEAPESGSAQGDAGGQDGANESAPSPAGAEVPAGTNTGSAAEVAAGGAVGGETSPQAATAALMSPTGVTISVTGPKRGRWRIGRHFTPEPVLIQLDDLTEAEAEALASDPKLQIALVT